MIKTRHSTATEPRSFRPTKILIGAFRLTPRFNQANIKLEQYGYAIADATKAIELDSKYTKVIPIDCFDGRTFLTAVARHFTEEQLPIPPYSNPETL